tara:strand:+ start:3554 stop:4180 length:627 start_codon:yes stop_codon:yes gene_type:complete
MARRKAVMSVDWPSLKAKLRKPKPKSERIAREILVTKVTAAHEVLMEDFEAHEVTEEIKGGVGASNTSKTLSGYGDLFSFIGFESGSDPIGKVRDYLLGSIRINKRAHAKTKNGGYVFRARGPDMKELESMTPLPYDPSRSWIRGIERGISGLGYYLQSARKKLNNSRSGGGIQIKSGKLRSGGFRPVSYMSGLINQFYTRISKKFRA